MRNFLKKLLKFCFYAPLVLLALTGVLSALLHTSVVQTWVVAKATDILSQKLGTHIHIGKVYVRWFDTIILEDVSVKDAQHKAMIDVKRLSVNFKLAELQDSSHINLDQVTLDGARVHLIREYAYNGFNIDDFITRINTLSSDTSKSKSPKPFTIDNAVVTNATFLLDDNRKPRLKKGKNAEFDYNHFVLNDLNGTIQKFYLIADTVALDAQQLHCYNKASDLRIRELNARFLYCKHELSFRKLLLRANQSVLRKDIIMNYRNFDDFDNHFANRVHITANLDSSILHTQDVAHFATGLYNFKDNFSFTGKFAGTINDFTLHQSKITFGKNSILSGKITFRGLPEWRQSIMDFDLKKSAINSHDLAQYIGEETTSKFEKFGNITFDGHFSGLYNNFKTESIISTALGNAQLDLSMQLGNIPTEGAYKGALSLENFNLGEVFNDNNFQKINMSGSVEGKGLLLDNAVLNVNGIVKALGFKQYDYQNIYINGNLQRGLFDGKVSVKDTNLTFDIDGRLDIRNGKEEISLAGSINHANLRPLHFVKDDIQLQSKLKLNFSGFSLDNIQGNAALEHAYLTWNRRNLLIDSLFAVSVISDVGRTIRLQSDLLNAQASGKFKLTQAGQDIQRLIDEYQLYFTGNQADRNDYYARKYLYSPQKYNIDFDVLFKNTYPLLSFFYPDGKISRNTRVEGSFQAGNTMALNLAGQADTLQIGNYAFYQSNIELNTSKFSNSFEVLAALSVNSEKQQISNFAPSEKLLIDAAWDTDHISFLTNIRQQKSENRAMLNGSARFVTEGVLVSFQKSKFRILNADWFVNPESQVAFFNNNIHVQNLDISDKEQLIALDGVVSIDSVQALHLKAHNFQLQTLAPILQTDVSGEVNGTIIARNLYAEPSLESELGIKKLTFGKFLAGNLDGSAKWDDTQQQLIINYQLERNNLKVLELKGSYRPSLSYNPLQLTATLNQTNLGILTPFTQGIFSDFDGTATGKIQIKGHLSFPVLSGNIDVKKGHLQFDYLNTIINFDDKIIFGENEIIAKKLRLTDDEGNTATLQGGVFHDGFRNFLVSLKADFRNFKILNTTLKDNKLFYGTAYTTGKLDIGGTLNNLHIKADAKSDRNTRIVIPLDQAQDITTDDDGIQFASQIIKKDSLLLANIQNVGKLDVSGITMDLNFDITPDATCEIHLDRQSGDIIRGTGRGKMNLKIDTKGEFLMAGDYEIERGDYTFTFQNIINKKFQIRAGSRIAWSGDPHEAMLDIKAAYTQYTSLLPLVEGSSDSQANSDLSRPYPVNLIIALKERLFSPKITFDVEINERDIPPLFVSYLIAYRNRLNANEQELNRQVTSLLAFGQLMSVDPTKAYSEINVLNNLAEMISNQFSNLASQIDKNLQVNISYKNLSQSLMENLQLRFSYNFNDRIRITRSGGLPSTQNQNNATALIGDWSLEWLITRDGAWRLKGYNRNIQNPFQVSANNQNLTTGGVSMVYTKNFNYFIRSRAKASNEVGLRSEFIPEL